MQYTLGQAKKRLAESANAYGQADLRDLINNAIQALAAMSGWECLRKVLRFSSAGPGFVLPQGCAGLVRVCVNGKPTTVRGQDFRFVQSGPGDMARPPKGFVRVRPENVYDIGMKPVMRELYRISRLAAFSPSAGQPALVVKGIDPVGKEVRRALMPHQDPVYDDVTGERTAGEELGDVQFDGSVFSSITEVTVADGATDYVTLYAEPFLGGPRLPIATYHPEVKAPQFRHYELAGIMSGQPVEILAETRIDPLPLVNDSDVLPFSCLEPIEWVIRADWQMKAGEVTAAQKYQDMAAKWLKAQEITDDTIQTQVVINSVFEGSPGEISAESVNI